MTQIDLLKECGERLDRIENLCKQMCELLEIIGDMHKETEEKAEEKTEKERIAEENRIALMSLYDTNLLTRTRNALLRHGFKTVGQISSLSAKQILGIPHIGQQGLLDIQRMLTEYYRG